MISLAKSIFLTAVVAVAMSSTLVTAQPNFLFLIGEGQSWSSLSAQMDDRVPESASATFQTPNLDSIALEGVRFSNFYAAGPRCTASRVALYTGKNPAMLHLTSTILSTNLQISETTIAELLKESGYATAHFGKWHISSEHPSRYGYDESDGPTTNGGRSNVRNPNPEEAYGMAERGMDFMERSVAEGKPFYLQIAQYGGNNVESVLPATLAAVESRLGTADTRAAAAEDADITFGMLIDKLDELGVAEDTYVIYTTDHGAGGNNSPLSGGKGMLSEGGLRVPMLIRGPAVAAGTFVHQRTRGVDIFPTIAELAGAGPLPRGLEGGSLVGTMMNGDTVTVMRDRLEYVVHYPHYDNDPAGPSSAIYLGDYKLRRIYETGERQLYNLADDMAEQNNLASSMPDKVLELDEKLTEYLRSVDRPGGGQ